MNRTPVSSSNISSIGYDPSTSTLEVAFNSGGVYQYYNVPSNEYSALMNASSHGSYLAHHIKGRYQYRQI
ncbi:KTSC domain-containing protein [Cellulosilyticum sp. WCF-2]|uniref:KTSC domain-containing protein n=1 Tax=Cellulosilyticum sp. WCF-2 TaxID=2497860 RepID=UPI000F8D631C|nr:KTSC domain-containing protein [Cellulosilyticum sp. WCF-2]QEH68185.1 KTSC domain-containing protein [Cellulosilyticum sp. WCF-2]